MGLYFFIFVKAVQHERGPRNSTIRRQVAMYLRETTELQQAMIAHATFRPPYLPGMPGVTPINEPIRVSAVGPPSPGSIAGTVLRQPTAKVGPNSNKNTRARTLKYTSIHTHAPLSYVLSKKIYNHDYKSNVSNYIKHTLCYHCFLISNLVACF